MIRKSCRPVTATLRDGRIISIADLPPVSARWVASRKEIVVQAVAHGLIEREEVIRRYNLSDEEFDSWCKVLLERGVHGLKITRRHEGREKN